ncbi:type VII toxin-antitoxin system HepT family RNase toxin [Lacimicrobium alkaliphilum]|uniref:DUF86 domain-containing protein n=1 Tax=Lacimicrobium alkaliphilum TaxID=1526571 RepID=A0ABQ1R6I8_9ALTE|nr:DUF86 domain-containing protein [Lacimicrobium alkaliphilum]GGD57780.1 hypothetical protein GCM10011357_11460 [Lacimicrobium alkaliphilum]
MVDKGLKLYLKEVSVHIDECIRELDMLSADSDLNRRDCLVAERVLQMLTETNIGLAKHWLKGLGKQTGTNAYQTFQALAECGKITPDELLRWKKIIGLRNALVHDYLNLDRDIVKKVVKSLDYRYLKDFGHRAVEAINLL